MLSLSFLMKGPSSELLTMIEIACAIGAILIVIFIGRRMDPEAREDLLRKAISVIAVFALILLMVLCS